MSDRQSLLTNAVATGNVSAFKPHLSDYEQRVIDMMADGTKVLFWLDNPGGSSGQWFVDDLDFTDLDAAAMHELYALNLIAHDPLVVGGTQQRYSLTSWGRALATPQDGQS